MVKDELLIIKDSKKRLDAVSSVSGIAMDVYEFDDDNVSKRQKFGHIYQVNKADRISFKHAQSHQKSYVEVKGGSNSIEATFLTADLHLRSMMEGMVDRGLSLKHDGVLKTLMCAESPQLSKVVIGFTQFDITLDEYLNDVKAKLDEGKIVRDAYLPDFVKEMIRCGWMAVEEIWVKGYTADSLDQATSYAMVGANMKILPYFIRTRSTEEVDKMALRIQFADMLKTKFVPLWLEPELDDLISLMKNPNASMNGVLGHPVLSGPARRQLLYRTGCSTHLNHLQSKVLGNGLVSVSPDWQAVATRENDILGELIHAKNFSKSVHGALHFGRIVSAHYLQLLKKRNKGYIRGFRSDTIDKLLKHCLVGLLSKRYNLNWDSDFIAAS